MSTDPRIDNEFESFFNELTVKKQMWALLQDSIQIREIEPGETKRFS